MHGVVRKLVPQHILAVHCWVTWSDVGNVETMNYPLCIDGSCGRWPRYCVDNVVHLCRDINHFGISGMLFGYEHVIFTSGHRVELVR